MTESVRSRSQHNLRHNLIVLVLAVALGSSPSVAGAICGDGSVDSGTCSCPCDCSGDCAVTVDEILTAINIALGSIVIDACPASDPDGSLSVTVDEVVSCINVALTGCPDTGSGAEECDDGGLCVGGANAGTACTVETDCMGDGACFGGVNNLRGCVSDDDCAGAPCRRCRPYGGDGCAANCTAEAAEVCTLVPSDPNEITPFGSRAEILAPVIPLPPLPLVGSQVHTVGRIVDGSASIAIKSTAIELDAIPVSSIACACTRGVEAHTCGGTLFDRDGAEAPNCTPGFVGIEECPPDKACAPVHGPGNAGSGFIGCGDAGFDVDIVQDCNGTPGEPPLDPVVTITRSTRTVAESRGSGLLGITAAIGTVVGQCTGSTAEYGPDGIFCTDDDPVSSRGTPRSISFTTNTAMATVLNPGDFPGDILGPVSTIGMPFMCNDGMSIGVSGTDLAGTFTSCDQPTVSDIAVAVNFVCE